MYFHGYTESGRVSHSHVILQPSALFLHPQHLQRETHLVSDECYKENKFSMKIFSHLLIFRTTTTTNVKWAAIF